MHALCTEEALCTYSTTKQRKWFTNSSTVRRKQPNPFPCLALHAFEPTGTRAVHAFEQAQEPSRSMKA